MLLRYEHALSSQYQRQSSLGGHPIKNTAAGRHRARRGFRAGLFRAGGDRITYATAFVQPHVPRFVRCRDSRVLPLGAFCRAFAPAPAPSLSAVFSGQITAVRASLCSGGPKASSQAGYVTRWP